MHSALPLRYVGSSLPFLLLALACQSRPAPPEPSSAQASATPAQPSADLGSSAAVTASTTAPATTPANGAAAASAMAAPSSSVASAAPSAKGVVPGDDPAGGSFTLEEALKGLPKTGKLVAEIQTDAGKLKCELYEDKAPITVANFVGLARGLRPFKDPRTREWVKRPAYDNGVFHRIIKGFMIQGGDPTGTGRADGGYVFADENWPGAKHDRRGLICMANKGKNTNSMQFFITDGAAPHLDGGYTIFGSCSPDATIEKLAATEVRGDRAVVAPKIKQVTIKRVK